MATYKQALEKANRLTRKVNKETSATKLLMLHFSGLEPTELYLKYEEEMPKDKYITYFEALDKYLINNIPVQQIIGYVYFYGYKFIVDDKVLIPRFETEELVANVLMLYDEYFEGNKIDIVDIGTGSGCLAVSLKKEESDNFTVTATDISVDAINVAKQNAMINEADVNFLAGNMLDPVKNMKFDILVSNPPYIPQNEVVEDIIYDNEPHVALFGGEDGLKFYREILTNAAYILKDKAIIAFEHGYDKAEELRSIAKHNFPNAKIFTLKDMQNLDRMTFIIIN
jgi:release factor glutamine methyltransferase